MTSQSTSRSNNAVDIPVDDPLFASYASLARSFLNAVDSGDSKTVRIILSCSGISKYPNFINYPISKYEKTSPLHTAVNHGSLEVCQLLIQGGADVNGSVSRLETPLHCAVFSSNLFLIKLLCDAGADVNLNNCQGLTPLHHACRKNDKPVISLLIGCGADVNVKDTRKQPPLHYTADGHGDDIDIMRMLKSAGAEVNMLDAAGRSPLHVATTHGYRGMTQYLIE